MPGTRKPQPKPSSRAAQRQREADNAQAQPSFGRLERINVRRLLGQFSHDIGLPESGPAILTGANGTGKSTLLRLVNAIGAGDWMTVAGLPFESAALHFDSGARVDVQLKEQRLRITDTEGRADIDLGELEPVAPQRLAAMSPAERRRYRDYLEMVMMRRKDLPSETGVFYLAGELREQEAFYMNQLRFIDDRAREVIQRIAERFQVRFITDQRLIMRGDDRDPTRAARDLAPGERPRREQVADRVTHYARRLGEQMTGALGEYANVSQREDRGFPERVAQELTRDRSVAVEELLPLMDEVAERRLALERVGLVESVPEPSFDLAANIEDPNVRIVFKTFAAATLRKFRVLEDLQFRLELFTSFLNKRFVGKAAVPRSDTGLTFLLDDRRELEPAQLSSGEQQLAVLAYEVLFETPRDTLLLIDEPEISLHVLWQSTFVDDIAEMGRPRNLSFLLATHSPTLIGGRRDLMRSLDPH